MAGSVVPSNVFQNQAGPIPLSQLDTNFNQLAAAINSLLTFGNYYTDAGAANSLAVTVTSPQTVSYTAGLVLYVKVSNSNTGATTLNVNGLGTRNVVTNQGAALVAGQITAGGAYLFVFDGTNFQLQVPSTSLIPGDIRLYGAKVDGVTDDTAAITLAIAAAGTVPPYFPPGTALTTASIPGFHAALKWGPGYVKRGANSFAISPKTTDTNQLFVSTSGNDSNDGLGTGQAFLTPGAAANAWQLYPTPVHGRWQMQCAAGTYAACQITLNPGFQSDTFLEINGAGTAAGALGTTALPLSQTTIFDGGSVLSFCITGNGNNTFAVQNVTIQNYVNLTNAFGVVAQEFSYFFLYNVQFVNCDNAIKMLNGRILVGQGVIVLGGVASCTSIGSSVHTLGYGASNQHGWIPATSTASGTGVTATITFPAQPSAPIVGSWVHVKGMTPSGYNGFWKVTASSTTSVSFAAAATGAQTVAGNIVYNIGAQTYGPYFADASQLGFLAEEDANGHADYTTANNCAVGFDIIQNSHVQSSLALLVNNTGVGVRQREGSSWNRDPTCTLANNGIDVQTASFSDETVRQINYTSYLMPGYLGSGFANVNGTTSPVTIATITNAIPANSLTYTGKKWKIRIGGNIAGSAGAKTISVQLQGASGSSPSPTTMATFTTAAGWNGDFIWEDEVTALSSAAQGHDGFLEVDNGGAAGTRIGTSQTAMAVGIQALTALVIGQLANSGDTITVRWIKMFEAG
jgi:hypothetical protein